MDLSSLLFIRLVDFRGLPSSLYPRSRGDIKHTFTLSKIVDLKIFENIWGDLISQLNKIFDKVYMFYTF